MCRSFCESIFAYKLKQGSQKNLLFRSYLLRTYMTGAHWEAKNLAYIHVYVSKFSSIWMGTSCLRKKHYTSFFLDEEPDTRVLIGLVLWYALFPSNRFIRAFLNSFYIPRWRKITIATNSTLGSKVPFTLVMPNLGALHEVESPRCRFIC